MSPLRDLYHRSISSRPYRLLGVSAIVVGITGCAQLTPVVSVSRPAETSQQTSIDTQSQALPVLATSAPTTVPPTRTPAAAPVVRTATVQKGPLADVLLLNGRVAGLDETTVAFPNRGTVDSVYVQPGQAVSRGQILADEDAKQLQKDLAAAQSKVVDATESLKNAQQQAALAQSQSTDRRSTAIADAQGRLDQATSDFQKVQAGAAQSDRRAADTAVALAQNNVDKATADLAKLTAPPDPSALRTAQQQVTAAQLALQSAQADQTKLTAGPDPGQVRDAQRALADAKTSQLTAQADLDRLKTGPDPYDVRAAQRAVDLAQLGVGTASATAKEDSRTDAQRAAAVKGAQLALLDAQDRLAKLKQPPDKAILAMAQTKLDDTFAAVAAAQDKLDLLNKPADPLALQKAQGAVDAARATLDNAQASLAQLQAGTSPDAVQNGKATVDAANMALADAQMRRDEINSHPTPAELKDAQARVTAAQQALDKARTAPQNQDPTGTTVGALQRVLDDAQRQLADVEHSVEAAHLRAPADGVVAQVLVQPGDSADPGKSAIVLAQSSDPVVRVNLLDGAQPKRVQVGQSVKVQLDGSDTTYDGKVADFAQPASNGDRIALITTSWGSAKPSIGTGARANITVQQKGDALIVPRRAIQSAGGRTYVVAMDGTSRKIINVDVGITTATDAELLSGVTEGQTIVIDSVLDPTTSGYSAPLTPLPAPGASAATPMPTSSTPSTTDSVATPAAANTQQSSAGSVAPLPAATAGPLVLEERFADNSRGWLNDPTSTAWIQDGAYHLVARQATNFVAVGIPGSDGLNNGSVSATFQKTGGPAGGGYGLILRNQNPTDLDGTNQMGTFYVFEVGDNGDVGIWQRQGSRWIDIRPWTRSNTVRTDRAANVVSVNASGPTFTFVVNGTTVATITDSRLASGSLGIFAGGDGNQVAVQSITLEAAE